MEVLNVFIWIEFLYLRWKCSVRQGLRAPGLSLSIVLKDGLSKRIFCISLQQKVATYILRPPKLISERGVVGFRDISKHQFL